MVYILYDHASFMGYVSLLVDYTPFMKVYCYAIIIISYVLSAVVISELLSDDGIIDIAEGESYSSPLFLGGFSYGDIPLKISTLTYSEYAAGGYDLENDFDPSLIPMDAADGIE